MKQSNDLEIESPARILIIDDAESIRQLFSELLQEAGHTVDIAKNVKAAQTLLNTNHYDVVIADIIMPGLSGMDFLRIRNETTPDIPFILITGNPNMDSASEAIQIRYAVNYLVKPVSGPVLLKAVSTAVEIKRAHNEINRLASETRRQQQQLEEQTKKHRAELADANYEITRAHNFTLDVLVSMLDAREKYARKCAVRVREFSLLIAQEMDIPENDLEDIACGTLLHDIGKMAIPEAILEKPGKLTEEEWKVIRTHPPAGYDMICSNKRLEAAAEIILSHHERYDGQGYPRGLKGDEICLGAQIFAVVDAYDAMRSTRIYSKSKPVKEAVEEIQRCSGTQFHPKVVSVFMACLPQILQWDTYDQEKLDPAGIQSQKTTATTA